MVAAFLDHIDLDRLDRYCERQEQGDSLAIGLVCDYFVLDNASLRS